MARMTPVRGQGDCNTFWTFPKDPAVLKILRCSKLTRRSKFTIAQGFAIARTPCADIIFLGFAGISPLKEGFTASWVLTTFQTLQHLVDIIFLGFAGISPLKEGFTASWVLATFQNLLASDWPVFRKPPGSTRSRHVGAACLQKCIRKECPPRSLRSQLQTLMLELRADLCRNWGKLFYLQLELFCLQLSFFACSPLRPLLDALSHCKEKLQL